MAVDKELRFGLTVWILIALLIGGLLGFHIGSGKSEDPAAQEHQRQLRMELELEKSNVIQLRTGLSSERARFRREITKSILREDSIRQRNVQREIKLQREINRLKTSTVKELENEAERIYLESLDAERSAGTN